MTIDTRGVLVPTKSVGYSAEMASPDRRLQVPPSCDLTLGMVCLGKPQPGETIWRMLASEKFANTAGAMQGGMVAAFLDSAMGASAVTYLEGRRAFVANTDLNVRFLKPVRIGSTLTAEARVISGGRRAAFVEGEVTDDAGRTVARASATYLYAEREPTVQSSSTDS